MSLLVKALFSPPALWMGPSKSLAFLEPANMRCSKRCAKPVLLGFSSREPTLYSILTAAMAALLSWWMMTFKPLGKINREKLIKIKILSGCKKIRKK